MLAGKVDDAELEREKERVELVRLGQEKMRKELQKAPVEEADFGFDLDLN